MKFPTRRTNTITRANVRHAQMMHPNASAHDIALKIHGATARKRHVNRAASLMGAREGGK